MVKLTGIDGFVIALNEWPQTGAKGRPTLHMWVLSGPELAVLR